jgi:hypothetical protein
MKPKKFKESNVIFAENQTEYAPLPAFRDESGIVVSCWNLSFLERLKVLFTGSIWTATMTFNQPIMPMYITTNKKEVLENK